MRTPNGSFYIGSGAELAKKLKAGWALVDGWPATYSVRNLRKNGKTGSRRIPVTFNLAMSLPRTQYWLRETEESDWNYKVMVPRNSRRAKEVLKELSKQVKRYRRPSRKRVRSY